MAALTGRASSRRQQQVQQWQVQQVQQQQQQQQQLQHHRPSALGEACAPSETVCGQISILLGQYLAPRKQTTRTTLQADHLDQGATSGGHFGGDNLPTWLARLSLGVGLPSAES